MLKMNTITFSIDKKDVLENIPDIHSEIEKLIDALKTVPNLSFRNKMDLDVQESFVLNEYVINIVFY